MAGLSRSNLRFVDLSAKLSGSNAGTMPTPLEAVYGATKAFGLSFAQSLQNELKETG